MPSSVTGRLPAFGELTEEGEDDDENDENAPHAGNVLEKEPVAASKAQTVLEPQNIFVATTPELEPKRENVQQNSTESAELSEKPIEHVACGADQQELEEVIDEYIPEDHESISGEKTIDEYIPEDHESISGEKIIDEYIPDDKESTKGESTQENILLESPIASPVASPAKPEKVVRRASTPGFPRSTQPRLTKPKTPFLSTSLRPQKDVGPSSDERELAKIEQEKKVMERKRLQAKQFMGIAKLGLKTRPVAKKAALTEPESPMLRVNRRPAAKAKVAQPPAPAIKKRMSFQPGRLTKPRPFNLSSGNRNKTKASTSHAKNDYVPVASRVQRFLHKTPMRFHTKPSKAGPELPSPVVL